MFGVDAVISAGRHGGLESRGTRKRFLAKPPSPPRSFHGRWLGARLPGKLDSGLFPNRPNPFPKEPSHDTASSPHVRRHAVAQSLHRDAEKLRPPHFRAGPILSDQSRTPQPGRTPRISIVLGERTPLVPRTPSISSCPPRSFSTRSPWRRPGRTARCRDAAFHTDCRWSSAQPKYSSSSSMSARFAIAPR